MRAACGLSAVSSRHITTAVLSSRSRHQVLLHLHHHTAWQLRARINSNRSKSMARPASTSATADGVCTDDLGDGQRPPVRSVTQGLRTAAELGFKLAWEDVVFSRWLQLSNRTVCFPPHDGRPAAEHEFDVIGHPRAAFQFAVVFPFHPAHRGQPMHEVTLLREYSQGVNEMMFVLPTGAFDPRRHADSLAAAQAELSEEAHLRGGEWIDLMPNGAAGPPESKWCSNRMRPWLCVDPAADAAPGAREAEEFIEVHRITLPELKRVLRGGQMMLPSVCASYFALDELERRKLF